MSARMGRTFFVWKNGSRELTSFHHAQNTTFFQSASFSAKKCFFVFDNPLFPYFCARKKITN